MVYDNYCDDDVVPPHLASLVGHLCTLNLSVLIKLVSNGTDAPGFDDPPNEKSWLLWPAINVGTKFLVLDVAVKYDIDDQRPLMWLKVMTANTDDASDILYGWISIGGVTDPNNRRTPLIQVVRCG